MPVIARRPAVKDRLRHRDFQLLQVTDRLFHDYADTPVLTIVRAVSGARAELRAAGVVPVPVELLDARARGILHGWGAPAA